MKLAKKFSAALMVMILVASLSTSAFATAGFEYFRVDIPAFNGLDETDSQYKQNLSTSWATAKIVSVYGGVNLDVRTSNKTRNARGPWVRDKTTSDMFNASYPSGYSLSDEMALQFSNDLTTTFSVVAEGEWTSN